MKFSVQLQSLPDISASLGNIRRTLFSDILLVSEVRDAVRQMDFDESAGQLLSGALEEMEKERDGCIQLHRAIDRIGEAYASCEAAAVDICEGAAIRYRQRTPEAGDLSLAADVLESLMNPTETGGR